MEIVLVGLNHRTAPVELRERVSFTPEEARQASEELRARGVLSETLVLSTCNRSELYGVPPESATDSVSAMELFLATFHQIEPTALNGNIYRRHDREAVRHLFRVAAGLDSMLLGEAEILGQVREAYRIALDHGGTGPVLNRMFQSALEVGKRVRAETEISTRPMSVAFAGVKLAERIFGSLRSHAALILGAGSTGEQVVAHLHDRGISRLRVANRSRERANELADRFGAEVVDWNDAGIGPRMAGHGDLLGGQSGADRVTRGRGASHGGAVQSLAAVDRSGRAAQRRAGGRRPVQRLSLRGR